MAVKEKNFEVRNCAKLFQTPNHMTIYHSFLLLVFIIYAALFHNYTLLFLPVGAEFQELIADADASSILASPPSTMTSTVVPTAQKFDSSITQSIRTIQTRRITSIITSIKSSKSITSWWVLRN